MPRKKHAEPPFYWIENHGLLRDEGVVFGLTDHTGAGLQHKLDCIQGYYEEKAAMARQAIERLDESIAQLTERKESLVLERSVPSADMNDSAVPNTAAHLLLRYGAGGVLAFLACALNYALIYELLEPHFDRPGVIAAGVLIAGLFTLSQPSSLLFISDDSQRSEPRAPESWKQWFIELALPIAAALFATVWSASELGPALFAVTFLFVLMLFLAGGKLLLSTLAAIPVLYRPLARSLKERADRRKRDKERQAVVEEIERLRMDKAAAESPESWRIRGEAAQKLFLSEYKLAQAAAGMRVAAAEALLNTNDGGTHEIDI